MDNREDPGQYYPGGSVVPARPEPAAHPVESVNGHAGNVVLDASDVGALPDTTAIPTADTVSGWGFLRKTWANLTSAFASIVHTHTKSNITDFAHGHSQSDVTGLTTALSGKQAELVSGTNIKTVNGQSLLGSGDIEVEAGGGVSSVNDKTGDVDIVFSAGNTSVTYTSATIPLSPDVSLVTVGTIAFGQVKPTLSISGEGDVEATVPTPSSPAAYEVKVPVPDLSSYVKAEDVPAVVAPSATAAEDAAASAKATGEALATLSASVPTAVSDLSDAGDYLKKSGGTMTGDLTATKIYANEINVNTIYPTDGSVSPNWEGDSESLRVYGWDKLKLATSGQTITQFIDSRKPTKTSELTNDSGFVTADAIPAPSAIANSTSKIDADGNVFDAGYIYDGGSITDSDGLVYKNCTKSGTKYTWTTDGGVSFTYDSSNGAVETKNGNSTGAGTNKDPFAGAIVVNNFTRWGVTYSHTNTATYDFHTTPTDRLARESKIPAAVDDRKRYKIENPTVAQETVDGVTYNSVHVSDFSTSTIEVTDSTPWRIYLPAPVVDTDGNAMCRDFIIKVKVTADTPPSITFVKDAGDSGVAFEAADEDWATLEQGINYFSFTESER